MRIEDIVNRVVSRFIGTKHERDIKRLTPRIAAINELASEYEKLTDSEIKEKSASLKFQVTERLGNADPTEPDYKQRLADEPPPPSPVSVFAAKE